MALTKVTKSGLTDNAVDASKIEDGTIVDADITPGTITNAKLAGSIANDKLANSSITINGSAVSLGGSVTGIGKVQWQAKVTSDGSTVTTMVAGRGYFVDNSSAAGIVKLPASAATGDTIAIKDYAGNFATNKLTIQRNGHNIQGIANDGQLKTNRASVVLVYIDSTKGWLYTNESNVADLQLATHIEATGGTVTTTGDFKVHVFTADGNFVVSQTGNAPVGGPGKVDYLLVAGGARGIVSGGGGGGFRLSYPSPCSCAGTVPVSVQTYPVTVGAGGSSTGGDSVFSTVTAAGGGKGRHYVHPTGIGEPGGSGGGAAKVSPANVAGGTGNDPPVSPPQGNNGGTSGPCTSQITGGGGGGAGQAGSNGPGGGGNGAPVACAFFGPPVAPSYGTPGPSPGRFFSGGGGGSKHQPGEPSRSGGAGGGGTGEPGPNDGTAGTTNTGGGGGGATSVGKNGGSGLVVIRYKYQN